jgi:tRNA threonylcarbamoyladenosine biosynthesis protein TsaE
MLVFLNDTQATENLGLLLARSLPPDAGGLALLMEGQLGCGKTTFTRGFVHALPGGNLAEVSSPSFTIVNYYPTKPPVAHFDLYRLEGAGPEEELLESLSSGDLLVIVEWAEYLAHEYWPQEYLHLCWRIPDKGREVRMEAKGERSLHLLRHLQSGIDAGNVE